jgi:hypothetical protein
MSETASCVCRPTVILGATLLLISSSVSTDASSFVRVQSSLVESSLFTATTSSKAQHLPGEMTCWQQVKAKRIQKLRGKYRDVLTPSREFAKQKQLELELGIES